MQYAYEPYILRRTVNGQVFLVNSNMPFHYFIDCFQNEQAFFLISQLEDGRIAITPNAMCVPWSLLQTGFWPQDLLPTGYEYVTMKHGTYPVIVTAHPITNFEDWYRQFCRYTESFAGQTLWDFVSASTEYLPVKLETGRAFIQKEKEVLVR